MFRIRAGNQRGHTQIDWLNSYHTFSFGDYYDSRNMGFSDLRVINDDIVAPGKGFGIHPHDNMEIISIIISGTLEHKDSIGTGNSSTTHAGEIQVMSAGTGIMHAEFNPSYKMQVHFLQIWILPDKMNHKPKYQQKAFGEDQTLNQDRLIVSPNGRKGSLKIHQDAEIYQTILEADKTIDYKIIQDRKYWLQIIEGSVDANGQILANGDGMAIFEEEGTLQIRSINKKSNFILFNLRR